MTSLELPDPVQHVLAADNCSGCGVCALVFPGVVDVVLNSRDQQRPVPAAPYVPDVAAEQAFARVCPGVSVQAGPSPRTDLDLGPRRLLLKAWASDRVIRHRGSSGGVITALLGLLVSRNLAAGAVRGSAADARISAAQLVTNKQHAVDCSGSRYAPGSAIPLMLTHKLDAVVVKPCEASALRALMGDEAPLLLSFFCAGIPSQGATDRLVGQAPDTAGRVTSLRYRGNGWPGRLRAGYEDGSDLQVNYEQAWGRILGPAVQWRCKICPDGLGESADIVAGDLWKVDAAGRVSFDEAAGESVLIARTARGEALVRDALDARVLHAEPVDSKTVCDVQRHQGMRRRTLAGRLVALRLVGRPTPSYKGFALRRLLLMNPSANARAFLGTLRRARRASSSLPHKTSSGH